MMGSQLPSGTLTFLFTDIEGSTRLWESEPEAMQEALERHDDLLREAIETANGQVVKTTGDGFHAVFVQPLGAVAAAMDMQTALWASEWPTSAPLRIRVGLHTGDAQLRDGDYYSPAVNRAARLMAAAHGGQIVCSAPTAELVRGELTDSVRLTDLGEHRLRDLARSERVFQLDSPGRPHEFPGLRSIDTLPGNLPFQPNRFVGRDGLIAKLSAQLADAKVVTITGPGGVGKTRLALQVAVAAQPDFADGAWFIDLAPATSPDQVVPEMLETLDYLLAEGEPEIEGLCKRLRRRSILLILDNCEHLSAAVAEVADAVSKSADRVRILATSREGLGIAAEQVEPIPPLDTGPEGDAVRLFVTRARAARPNFILDDKNRDTVVELCRRLDGIPLALELAAARTRSVSPSQILERIDERFRILTSGSSTSSARHQTLRATVDWSYDMLTPEEQTVLCRLAVFSGGFTLDAAEGVVSDEEIDTFSVLDHVDTLVDKSLVVAEDTARGLRYRLLETIRQYARERLQQASAGEQLRERHAAFFLRFARKAGKGRDEPGQIETMDELEAELDNLRQMIDWLIDEDRPAEVIEALESLGWFLTTRDHTPWVIHRLDRCLDAALDDNARLVALGLRAWFGSTIGHPWVKADIEEATRLAERSGSDLPLMASSAMAVDFELTGDADSAISLSRQVAGQARERGDQYWFAQARTNELVFQALKTPNEPLTELAAEVRRDLGASPAPTIENQWLLATAMASAIHDPELALQLFQQSLSLATNLQSRFAIADAHFFTGLMQLGTGDPAGAAANCRSALVIHHDVGMRRGIFMDLGGACSIAIQTGSTAEAVPILAGLRQARIDHGLPGSSNEQFAEERVARRIAREVGDGALAETVAPDLETTIDMALRLLETIARDPALAGGPLQTGDLDDHLPGGRTLI